eukprot:CAMPEP_0197651688 /NCGR_PEP_ID=MMETSP1338-20131121/33668_1 /TAXON_ID=43686 ORGANISM="Pelagodinium beii, Strain RCC1491" /NCGR_SAMPLE_ID=MMETSP1338 /ASSEMBLY_ACC=CAM_ASM_000754 /LENGTH=596 /DNA_ID=CAMNT_0043226395 /DNA_START=50 /DNA_END=1840 /DNA_ORIENTATION=-
MECSLSHSPSSLSEKLSRVMFAKVVEYLTVADFQAFHPISSRCRDGLRYRLADDPTLLREWETHLANICNRRVWVGIRVKPQEVESCMEIVKRRISVEGTQFFFNRVFDGNATQAQVWNELNPMLWHCMKKRESACLMAYGQTGSGKTHTMFGNPEIPGEEGMAIRAVRALGALLKQHGRKKSGKLPEVKLSFLEVYNEKVRDLLGDQKLCPLSTKQGRVEPQGLTHYSCNLESIEQDVVHWINEGAASRVVGRTVFNPQSSRSHAVATLHIHWGDCKAEEDTTSTTRIYLVDLAGSERAGQYALSAQQLKEGSNINKSLSVLGRVVSALARGGKERVPVRDSTLTWLLSDAIASNTARIFMVAAVQPAHAAETLSTLRYAHQYSMYGSSDLDARVHQATERCRSLRTSDLPRAQNEFDEILFKINFQGRVAAKWNLATLRNQAVRITLESQALFGSNPFFTWTDAHQGKAFLRTVGYIRQSVSGPPPAPERADLEDGRVVLEDQPQRADAPFGVWWPPAIPLESLEVVFPGHNGRSDTVLWCPAGAVANADAPRSLREAFGKLQRVEERLQAGESSLATLCQQLSEQQQRWMEED